MGSARKRRRREAEAEEVLEAYMAYSGRRDSSIAQYTRYAQRRPQRLLREANGP